MMSSSMDMLVCLISCFTISLAVGAGFGSITGSAGFVTSGLFMVFGLTFGLTVFAEVTFLSEPMRFGSGSGFVALAVVIGADAFLILIIGLVVEVWQSGHLSLYSGKRRPHFRQNGICSTSTFLVGMIAKQSLNL